MERAARSKVPGGAARTARAKERVRRVSWEKEGCLGRRRLNHSWAWVTRESWSRFARGELIEGPMDGGASYVGVEKGEEREVDGGCFVGESPTWAGAHMVPRGVEVVTGVGPSPEGVIGRILIDGEVFRGHGRVNPVAEGKWG